MKYLTSGAVLFIIYLINLVAVPKLFFPNTHPVPTWFSIIQVIIALLFFFLAIQTTRQEKKYVAGILFFILGLITIFTWSMGNLQV